MFNWFKSKAETKAPFKLEFQPGYQKFAVKYLDYLGYYMTAEEFGTLAEAEAFLVEILEKSKGLPKYYFIDSQVAQQRPVRCDD